MRITNPSEVKPGDVLVINDRRTKFKAANQEGRLRNGDSPRELTRDYIGELMKAGAIIERAEPMKWQWNNWAADPKRFTALRLGPFTVEADDSEAIKGKKFLVTIEEV